MRKTEQSTYIWLRRLNVTPKSMWIMPRITDIFILNELRKASLLLAIFQICEKKQHRVSQTLSKRKTEENENVHFKLNGFNHPGSIRL